MAPLSNFYFDSNDPQKPQFLFSSDINHQVLTLVNKYWHQCQHVTVWEGDLIDTGAVPLNVSLELNALLLRNPDLKTSDLIDQNHICLAKSNRPMTSLVYLGDFPVPVSNQVFILNLTLNLVHFELKNDEISIQFLDDELYRLLVNCDSKAIEQIENYVICKFRANLAGSEPSLAPTLAYLQNTTCSGSVHCNDISDSTLDGSIEDKSFSDLDTSSMHELNFTESCATIRDDTDIGAGNLSKPTRAVEEFIQNEDNLRHNEDNLLHEDRHQRWANLAHNEDILTHNKDNSTHNENHLSHILAHNDEYLNLDCIPEVECDIDEMPHELLKLHKNNVETLKPHENTISDEPDSFHSGPLPMGYRSPKKVSRKSSNMSVSMINDEDLFDLKYAMNGTDVPNYIKENKKFKFIKVGKVQKFVNLFEEKKEEPSRTSSPSGYRSPSPGKEVLRRKSSNMLMQL